MSEPLSEPVIFPLGDGALTVEFGRRIAVAANDRVLDLFDYFERNSFRGLIETVPAFCTLTIFYDAFEVRSRNPRYPTAFEAVRALVAEGLEKSTETARPETPPVEIPVAFDEESGPDLDYVAAINDLAREDVIEIFTSRVYRVFMLGFLPGFPYLGELDERIAAPRRSVPRLVVPRGSVGIAGRQTGIYPIESPGGWQLVGRTDFRLFDPAKNPPCTLRPGDRIRFTVAMK
ncbi:MAG: 5-oxoprolinase subunit PxpB [Acidobacteria bacterium]|nr:5-oxoprolinase subunit PxpB [Acidobacteriota bacterium]